MKSWAVLLSLLLPLLEARVGGQVNRIGDIGDEFPYPDPNSTYVPEDLMPEDVNPEDLPGYCDMVLQTPVGLSADKMPWDCICSHCKGTVGPKGDRGDRGMPGGPGSPGPRGPPGFRGAPGFTGRPGIKGQKGDDGGKGSPGLPGLTGPKGSLGFKGEKGDHGLMGPPGDQGPRGDDGECPDACEASQGPPGPPGAPGPAGIRGSPGTDGPKGQKGAPGVGGQPGLPGVPGIPGVKGDQGPEGDCDCNDGADGADGQKGDSGDTGPAGETGPKGDQGPTGEKGDQGMMGMMGPPGPCMPSVKSAFSAALTTSYPPNNLPVAFSKVFYNLQNSYIPSLGIYVAPINGTYVFSFHLTVYERALVVGLFHNFNPVMVTTDTRTLGTVSQTVILHLAEGDGVWLQVKDSASNGIYASPETSSVFSGYLLHPDRCQGLLPDMGFGTGTGRGGDLVGGIPGGLWPTGPPSPGPGVTPEPSGPKINWNDKNMVEGHLNWQGNENGGNGGK